jgi:hypothetical protein
MLYHHVIVLYLRRGIGWGWGVWGSGVAILGSRAQGQRQKNEYIKLKKISVFDLSSV